MHQVRHHASPCLGLPAQMSEVALEGVEVADASRIAVVGARKDQIADHQRRAVELGAAPWRDVIDGAISPAHTTSAGIDGVEDTLAAAEVNRAVRDRGRGEDSTAGLVFPDSAPDRSRELRGRE